MHFTLIYVLAYNKDLLIRNIVNIKRIPYGRIYFNCFFLFMKERKCNFTALELSTFHFFQKTYFQKGCIFMEYFRIEFVFFYMPFWCNSWKKTTQIFSFFFRFMELIFFDIQHLNQIVFLFTFNILFLWCLCTSFCRYRREKLQFS